MVTTNESRRWAGGRAIKPLLWVFFVLCLIPRTGSIASPVLITEFSAAGGQRLRDEDGDTPDWIEIQNRSGDPADLTGWALTEHSRHTRKWLFPATNLPPN